MHIREVHFGLVAQETRVLTRRRNLTHRRNLALGCLDGRHCTIRVVAPEAVD